MQYKLLALDIDGTLLDSKGVLTPRTVAAVHAASRAGLRVCLVSRRRARSMAPFARELGISDPMVCFNGGMVALPDNLELLHVVRIPRQAVCPIISAWEAAGIPVLACSDATFAPDVYMSGSSNWPPLVQYVQYEGSNMRRLASLVDCTDWDPMRVQVTSDEETGLRAAAIAGPLADLSVLRVIFSRDYDGSWYYELYPVQATKSSGLKWLGERFGIRREEIVAVGDHVNDLDMIEYAGLGVAMGNAQPVVKDLADLIIGDHDEDGLAVFIEEQLLGRTE